MLVQALQSVHDQNYDGEIEHIIIDGASDDGTLELLNKYVKKGWITVYSEKDHGVYDAMNKGITKASGKYTFFLNSDDYWINSEGVQKSISLLEQEEADFSFAPILVEDKKKLVTHRPEALKDFYFRMPFVHQSMFTRTDVLKDFGGFDSAHYRIAADYDFFLKIMLAGKKGVFSSKEFCVFRNGGISDNHFKMNREYVKIIYNNISKLYNITEEECALLYFRYAIFPELEYICYNHINNLNKKYVKQCNKYNICNSYKIYFLKNIFILFIKHKIEALFYNGINKEYAEWKIIFERKIISSFSKNTFNLFGINIISIYKKENINLISILGLPIFTKLKKQRRNR